MKETPSQTWTRITGRAWSEARSKGYTNGSAISNLALQKRLLGGWNPYAVQRAPEPSPSVTRNGLSEFVNKWNGKHYDYDGGYGAQCVDITKAWQKNLGLSVTSGNAKDWQFNYNPQDYTFVRNSLTAVPSPGDIVIFGTRFGPYGHIGICTSANMLNLTCFEQNNPIGSVCRFVFHPLYRGVVGWLKPRR